MSSIEILRDEYPGDEDWRNFAAIFKPDLTSDQLVTAQALIPEDAELAETLVGIFGLDGASAWIDRPIGVLDNQTAAHVIASYPDGDKIVRHAVMRMPV